ncbi:hypothetical protein T484DRAFT_1941391 [Baffinella frigidus]|nr:hypothetical protein T484DRAFT_1941391 [Cryptophyta sp. CCMP2293]
MSTMCVAAGRPADVRSKHKLVEQNRRQLTKDLVSDLQELVLTDAAPAAGINQVLEGTLAYLKAKNRHDDQDMDTEAGGDMPQANARDHDGALQLRPTELKLGGRICRGLTGIKYAAAFDSAPFGIVVARIDGTVVRANALFESLFRFSPGTATGQTMFSLTAPSDLSKTMQAVSSLLHGLDKVQLTKQCVKADGEIVAINTQMQCLWKNNQATHFLCYLRPTQLEDTGRFTSVSQASSQGGSPGPFMGTASANHSYADSHRDSSGSSDSSTSPSVSGPGSPYQH